MAKTVIKGMDNLCRRLRAIPAEIDAEVREQLVSVGNLLQNGIRQDVTGPRTGRVYTWRGVRSGETPDGFLRIGGRVVPIKNRDKPHQASAPGERPTVDFGDLRKSIEADVRRPSRSVHVFAGGHEAPHAAWLEFGTRRMAARPFLLRGVEGRRDEIVDELAGGAVRGILKALR